MRVIWLAVMGVGLVMAGCNDYGGKRAISGSVAEGGRSMVRGMIEFYAADQAAKTSFRSSVIVDGKYRIEPKHGLLPGNYRVRIVRMAPPRANGKDAPSELSPPGGDPPAEEKPKAAAGRSMAEWTDLKAAVPEKGDAVFNFDLKPK